jgi:hypothetical protein
MAEIVPGIRVSTTTPRLAEDAGIQAACEPSQKGLLFDTPQRHKVTRFRIS